METPKPLRPEDLFGCPDHQALPWANRRMLNMRHVRQNMWLLISQVAGDVIFPCICHVPVTHGCLLLSEAMCHPAETGPGLLHLQTHTFSWDCSSQREDLELPSDDFLIHKNMKRNTQPQSWDAVFQLPASPPDSSHSCSLTHPPGLPATSGTFWLSITPYFQATCKGKVWTPTKRQRHWWDGWGSPGSWHASGLQVCSVSSLHLSQGR